MPIRRRAALLATLALTLALTVPAAARPDHGRDGIDFSATHRIVFDLNSPDAAPGTVNPGLAAVSALLDGFRQQGTRAADMRIVVVLHAAYTHLARAQDNPNVALMRKLAADGTTFVVSGQSLAARGIAPADLLPGVKISPNANLVFFNLEEQGYVYSGTKGIDGE